MNAVMIRLALMLLMTTLAAVPARGQFIGSRGGGEGGLESGSVASLPMLEPEVVEGFIAIDGRAVVRVPPTEIRIVLAVTSESATAQDCHAIIAARIAKLTESWTALGVPAESIVEDFIAVLPMYEWDIEQRDDSPVAIEKKAGYRMQTNIHVAVADDAAALEVLTRAFQQGVADIIAFDYWSSELDAAKVAARRQAVAAARDKAGLLFDTLFDAPPTIANVQEQTTVRCPESLYSSFSNTVAQHMTVPSRRDLPRIAAHRPDTTYYRGLQVDSDVSDPRLPMHAEISVVSTVRLYYESGAEKSSESASDEGQP